jgi:hypothetical protein
MSKKIHFEFQSGDKKIEGKFGTWAQDRFCKKFNDLTVNQFLEMFETGMSIRAIAEMLFCGVEYYYQDKECPYNINHALDWIDDIGGLAAAVNIISDCVSSKNDAEGNKAIKKKVVKSH